MNKNKIDFATNDKILYQVICEASPQERQYLSSIISSKVSSNIQASEVDPIAITSEIQLMGGDTFFNKLRGHGVPYSEVAYDAAECLGIKVKGLSIDLLEEKIVNCVLKKHEETLSPTEKAEFERQISLAIENGGGGVIGLDKERISSLMSQYLLIALLTRAPAFLFPLLGQVLAALTVPFVFSGPAYRITTPCVFVVALLRAKLKNR